MAPGPPRDPLCGAGAAPWGPSPPAPGHGGGTAGPPQPPEAPPPAPSVPGARRPSRGRRHLGAGVHGSGRRCQAGRWSGCPREQAVKWLARQPAHREGGPGPVTGLTAPVGRVPDQAARICPSVRPPAASPHSTQRPPEPPRGPPLTLQPKEEEEEEERPKHPAAPHGPGHWGAPRAAPGCGGPRPGPRGLAAAPPDGTVGTWRPPPGAPYELTPPNVAQPPARPGTVPGRTRRWGAGGARGGQLRPPPAPRPRLPPCWTTEAGWRAPGRRR